MVLRRSRARSRDRDSHPRGAACRERECSGAAVPIPAPPQLRPLRAPAVGRRGGTGWASLSPGESRNGELSLQHSVQRQALRGAGGPFRRGAGDLGLGELCTGPSRPDASSPGVRRGRTGSAGCSAGDPGASESARGDRTGDCGCESARVATANGATIDIRHDDRRPCSPDVGRPVATGRGSFGTAPLRTEGIAR